MPFEKTRNVLNLLEDLPSAQWQKECPSLRMMDFDDETPIYRRGKGYGYVFLILKGRVKLSRLNQRGEEFTVDLLSAGEIFGAGLSENAGSEAQETAIAKGSVQLYRILLEEFKVLLARHPSLAWRVIQMTARREAILKQKLESVLFKDVRTRVAETLLDLTSYYGEPCVHGFKLDVKDIRLNQQELSDLVFASRPVVSTIVNELRDEGILNYDRTFICVLQMEALKRLITV